MLDNQKKVIAVSIGGGIVNVFLSFIKILVGLKTISQALIAEGIHSLSDVIVSLVTYFSIKKAQKEANKNDYLYNYEKYESVASLLIALILILTGLFIVKDALWSFWTHQSLAYFTWWGIIIMSVSLILNLITFRLKIYFGKKYSSLALVADGQHDKMDVLVSLGVLAGLFFVKIFPQADLIISFLIGLYIILESYELARTSIDGLMDASNPELEEKIKEFLKQESIEFTKLRTRRLGSKNAVNIEILLSPDLNMDQVTKRIKEIEIKIKDNFKEIRQVIIQVKSHSVKDYYICSPWGSGYRFQKKIREKQISSEDVSKKKNSWIRCVIPLDGNEVNFKDFGSKKFLVIDLDKESKKLLQKRKVDNPFWEEKRGHGIQFVRWIKADKVITGHIGPNAEKNLSAMGVELIKVSLGTKLEDVLEKFC